VRLCRLSRAGAVEPAYYFDDVVLPLEPAARTFAASTHAAIELQALDDLLLYLPPDGKHAKAARDIHDWFERNPEARRRSGVEAASAELLTPVPKPPKLFLLAGNYAEHIREGGAVAVERAKTFPYVFMKPPSTTLNHPGAAVAIPSVSPAHIDWEVELGVVIGKRARAVKEAEALSYVAGYTVVNDLSDREFRPNPARAKRERDEFFDWLHGKWHDGFCPAGPCVLAAGPTVDPQKLRLRLKVNGAVKQDASTAQQTFSVAAVIEFISSFVTLEPGDMISTGTPSGVGHASKTYLHPGDQVEAEIEGIGVLRNRMVAG
jgi:2-keto-4-pentenoate hydratase/2-oxohepta-3-ene-1,7-dioic acid hydratase in catechol pathway